MSFEKKTDEALRNEVSDMLTSRNVVWHSKAYHKRPRLFATLLDVLTMRRSARKYQKEENYDIIHCRSYIPAIAGLDLKRSSKVKLIFDMRGFWADERIEGNLWDKTTIFGNYYYKYFKKKEIEFINNADCVISLTHKAKKEILNWSSVPAGTKIEVIPCGVDASIFVSSESTDTIINHFSLSQDDFILTYLGSLGTWYLLEEMLDFFRELKKAVPNAKFVFFTKESPQMIKSVAEKLRLDPDDIRVKYVKRSELSQYLSISSLSIYFIKPTYSKIASSPIKLGELLSMGIPVVTNKGIGDCDDLLANQEFVLLVNKFDKSEYRKAINKLSLLNAEVGRSFADKHFSYQKGVEMYHKIYTSLK